MAHEADLDSCANYKDTLFDFARYRRPEVYGPITGQRGVEVPDHLTDHEESDGGEAL